MATVTRREPDTGSSASQASAHEGEWLVTLDAPGTNGDALQVSGAPRVGARLSTLTGGYASENGLFCTAAMPARIEGSLVDFIIRAQFESRPLRRPVEPSATPTAEPASWSFRLLNHRIAWREDWYGTPYQSAAKRPYQPIEFDEPGLVLTHERNENDTLIAQSQWLNSINADLWLGFGIGCVKLTDIDFRPIYNQSFISHYRVRREFQIRFPLSRNIVTGVPPAATAQFLTIGGWHGTRLNEDFYDINGTRFTDTAGANRVEPTLLTANGLALASGDAPCYMRFRDFQEVNFGQLNIVLN